VRQLTQHWIWNATTNDDPLRTAGSRSAQRTHMPSHSAEWCTQQTEFHTAWSALGPTASQKCNTAPLILRYNQHKADLFATHRKKVQSLQVVGHGSLHGDWKLNPSGKTQKNICCWTSSAMWPANITHLIWWSCRLCEMLSFILTLFYLLSLIRFQGNILFSAFHTFLLQHFRVKR